MTTYPETGRLSAPAESPLVIKNVRLYGEGEPTDVVVKDGIIAAIGKPNFVTADMVKPGAVVIDVGTTRVPDASKKSGFRLNGDVKFDEVAEKCSFITPVPGGVGPMTICSLMKNTLAAGKKEYYKKASLTE